MSAKKTNTSFIYGVALVILLSLGLTFFLRSSVFTIQQVVVEGLKNIPAADIQRLTSGIQGQNILLFDQEQVSRKISLHPLVQTVALQRKLPHTLVVKVTERSPAALVVVPKGVLEVDGQGVFLRRLESWPNTDYPVITGINVSDSAGPGQNLANPALTAALLLLRQAPAALLPMIGEIHVNAIQQLSLFLTSGVEVRLGQADEWKDKLTALYNLLNDKGYQTVQQGVRYIDFTAAKPVIGR